MRIEARDRPCALLSHAGAEALVGCCRRLFDMDDARLREGMIAEMRRSGSITSAAVTRAFERVPRHRFVPEVSLSDAYADRAISIKGEGVDTVASISQPSMLSRMLELAQIEPGNRVLEIGTGSGYNAALMSELAGPQGRIVTVEIEADLAERAAATLRACGYENVRVVLEDGHAGSAEDAPYDRIVVSARATDIAAAWWEQLADGGHIVVPLEIGIGGEYAVGFARSGNELRSEGVVHCLFVPLRGEQSASREHVFARSSNARYISRPRSIRSIKAVKTAEALPELLERADIVVAQPQTTFAVTWD